MATSLYLIRHGIAIERGEFPGADAERYLTAKGEHRTRQVAGRLHQLHLRFDHLWTSPLVRARQTAKILVQAGLATSAEIVDYLAPDGSFAQGLTDLRACLQPLQSPVEALAWVGHEPDLSQWAEQLIWGEVRGVLTLKKAGVIGLRLPGRVLHEEEPELVGHCQLFWLTAPGLLVD